MVALRSAEDLLENEITVKKGMFGLLKSENVRIGKTH
jgi:hypothetical protein